MRFHDVKATLKTVVLAVATLLLAAGVCAAQQQVNLTAGPATLTLPDGTSVPMWGYSCGAIVTGSNATCANLNTAATGWSPVIITVRCVSAAAIAGPFHRHSACAAGDGLGPVGRITG